MTTLNPYAKPRPEVPATARLDYSHLLGGPIDGSVDEHSRMLTTYNEAAAAFREATDPRAVRAAEDTDLQAATEALRAGKPLPAGKAAPALAAKAEAADHRLRAASIALTEIHSDLMKAAETQAATWIEDLREERKAAAADLERALAEVEPILDRLDRIRAMEKTVQDPRTRRNVQEPRRRTLDLVGAYPAAVVAAPQILATLQTYGADAA